MSAVETFLNHVERFFRGEILHTVSAFGRVCLVGEHCDYARGMSVGLPLHHKITLQGSQRKDRTITFTSTIDQSAYSLCLTLDQISIPSDHLLRYSAAAVKVLQDQGYSLYGADIFLTSDLPMKKGLSSSAAVTVGTLKLFNEMFVLQIPQDRLAELAYIAEHDILNIGCGRMDQIVSAYNSLVVMDYKESDKPKITPLPPAAKHIFILVCVPLVDKRDLPAILKASNKAYFHPERPEDYNFKNALDQLIPQQVVLPFIEAISKGDIISAGRCLRRNQEIYDQYFVPVCADFKAPLLYALLALAKKHGSLGEKWTGAGGIGAFICLTASLETQEKLQHALTVSSPVPLTFVTTRL